MAGATPYLGRYPILSHPTCADWGPDHAVQPTRGGGMKQLANMRKADKAHGDDTTLTRFIFTPGRHASDHRTALMPAGSTGTRFKSRVLPPSAMTNVLVSGHNNAKIGRDVRKGHLRGYWIYTLSLEERATCPSSCQHWRSCYGNSMPFAKRVKHGPEMLRRIEIELADLCAKKRGVLVRLHALGDFYSTDYVAFWDGMLRLHPNLAVFGYTAHHPGTEIGDAVLRVIGRAGFSRFAVRFSGWSGALAAVTIDIEADAKVRDAVVCPQQTGGASHCATCALCWGSQRNIAFLAH